MDSAPSSRFSRFWAAYDGTSVYLPAVMVDSGHQFSSGHLDFYDVYKAMVDTELVRLPEAVIEALWWRDGDKVKFYARVTNQSSTGLSTAANGATVHAIVYEDAQVGVTGRYARATASTGIASDLVPGASADFSLVTADLAGVNWDALHFLVLVDYRPAGTSGAYDVLQAAAALPAAPDMEATAENGNVILTWSFLGLFASYELWRDTDPYLDPLAPAVPVASGLPPGGCTLDGATITCVRPDGLANPDTNYFYVVRGILPSGVVVDSNRTGEFDFSLVAGA